MADYVLSAKGTYNGSNFDRGVKNSESTLDSFKEKCSANSIAIGNILANLAEKGWQVVSGNIDSAVSRVDKLNQFPKVMKNLGYEADVSEKVIHKLSDGIEGLPTTLDEIVGNTQALTLSLKDLDKASDVAIALNDGFTNYGASADQITGAITQLNQMITTGKYDMQSWNSINQAAPGFLDAVARSMLGETAQATDLRSALNDGKITSEQFLDQIVKLDKEGAPGIVAFSQSAQDAVGGIATSAGNAKTAFTKNLANMIDAVNGSGAISEFFDMTKRGINDAGKELTPYAEKLGNVIADTLEGKNKTINSFMEVADGVRDHLVPAFDSIADTGKDAFEDIVPVVEDIVPIMGEVVKTSGDIAAVFVAGAGEIIHNLTSFADEAHAVIDTVGNVVAPVRENLHGLVGDLDAGSSSAKGAASSIVTLGAGLVVSYAAMRKNEAGVSLLDRAYSNLKKTQDWVKASTANTSAAFTKYAKTPEGTYYKWSKSAQSYVQVQKTLPTALASSTVGIKAQTAAAKASAIASKAAAASATLLKNALRTVAPIAVITAILEIANALGAAKEKADTLNKATSGFKMMESYSESFRSASAKASGYGDSLKDLPADIDGVIQKQSELADSINKSWADVGAKCGAVEQYKGTIERLAGKTLDTKEEQDALVAAVEGLNQILDTSYTVVDKQNGVLSENKDQILAVADAWQQKAMAEAASSALSELYQQQVQNAVELAKAEKELAEAREGLNNATNSYEVEAYAQRMQAAQARVDEMNQAQGTLNEEIALTQSVMGDMSETFSSGQDALAAYISKSQEFSKALEDAGIDSSDFAAKLSEVGISTQDLATLTEGAFPALIDCYKNGWQNAKAVCDQYSIEIPATAQKTAEDTANASASLPESVGQNYDAAGAAAQSSIEGSTGGVVEAASDMVDGVVNETVSLNPRVAESTEGTGSSIAQGIQSTQDEAVAAASQVSKQVADHFSANTMDAWWAGHNMAGVSFKGGVDTGRNAAVSSADTLSKHVADHFSSRTTDAWWAGYNMSIAAAQGITAGKQSMIDAAADAVRAANEAARNAADEHSPSRIWRGYGYNMPKGGAIGIKAATGELVKAAERSVTMANRAITAIKIPFISAVPTDMSSRVMMPSMASRIDGSDSGFFDGGSKTVNFYLESNDPDATYAMISSRLARDGVI